MENLNYYGLKNMSEEYKKHTEIAIKLIRKAKRRLERAREELMVAKFHYEIVLELLKRKEMMSLGRSEQCYDEG